MGEAELRARLERYDDCLRTVCHHLELPQSDSGPCDDPSRYDRALEGLLADLAKTEAERKLAADRRFRAEAALQPFADAAKGLSDFWDDARRAATIAWDGIKVEHFRKARQALAVNAPAALAVSVPADPPRATGNERQRVPGGPHDNEESRDG